MCEDTCIACKIIERCDRIICTDEKLYYYVQNDSSLTHTMGDIYCYFKDSVDVFVERMKFFKKKRYRKMLLLQYDLMMCYIMAVNMQSLTNIEIKHKVLDYIDRNVKKEMRTISRKILRRHIKNMFIYQKFPKLAIFIFKAKWKVDNVLRM